MIKETLPSSNLPRFFWLSKTSVFVVFALLFFLTLFFIENQRKQLIYNKLDEQATKFSIQTAETLRLSVENLQAASSVMVFFNNTSYQQFEGVTSHYFKSDQGLLIVEWQPVVKSEDRAQFVAQTRLNGLPEFRLWEPDELGNPISAHQRAEHVPVQFMVARNAQDNDVSTFGLDLAWSPERMKSKLEARDLGRAQSSELFRVVTNATNTYRPMGFAITLPIYAKGFIPSTQQQRRQKLIGYMAGVYSVEALMKSQIASLTALGLNVNIHDHLNNENHYKVTSGKATDCTHEIDLDLFGNTLRLKLTATEAFVDNQFQLIWVILPGALVLFGLLIFLFLHRLEKQNHYLAQAQTDLKSLNEKLEDLSRHDPLTKIYNRRAFEESLNAELQRLQRYPNTIALLMLDIDHFKQINDHWGHPVGDKALIEFARQCQESSRQVDILGRLGGEEFAILLVESNHDDALSFAERLREKIASLHITAEENAHFSMTVSIGLSLTDKVMASNKLIEQADKALYLAKQHGRNRVEEYQST